jgi:predicted glycosyltransferase
MTAPPRLLFYCQHSVGMGHLMRSRALARALLRRFDVTFISGGALPDGVEWIPGVRMVQLPAVGVDDTGTMLSRHPSLSLDGALAERRRMIHRTYDDVQPHVIVIELFPFGRRKFLPELEPMLQQAKRGRPSPVPVYCSVRDILVSRDAKQREHDARTMALLARYFGGVLVHSDPVFATLEESLDPMMHVPVPVYYTGFVHDYPSAATARPRTRPGTIVVSAGGGQVGGPLLRATLQGHAQLPPTARWPLTVLAGPFLPDREWQDLQRMAAGLPDVDLRRSVPNLACELRQAAASISQCGYNTALDVLQARVPALVVPFGEGSEDEQLNRARRMARLGALQLLRPAEATPARLADLLTELPEFRPTAPALDLGGGRRTAQVLETLCRAESADAPRARALAPAQP